MNPKIQAVTDRIAKNSQKTRAAYLRKIDDASNDEIARSALSCGNLAHGFAACNVSDKNKIRSLTDNNIGIISSYNDILSAHHPYKDYPDIIKAAISTTGGVAQFAGGVPAMCDGVTQGQPGMDLSLMSRDTIALSASVALSHHMFDGVLMLGICDKIVPGLLISALSFGHLPTIFIPAGPMPSGLPNKEKARIRKLYAEGKVDKDTLLQAESDSYHSSGTCTFYGTANSNQLVIEMMGLHLPGSSFVNPNTPLREELTKAAAKQVTRLTKNSGNYSPLGRIIDEKSLVNGIVGLLASGGSTNHTLHLVAIARAAGIIITWQDFSDISAAVPLLTRIYPNGQADINHFQQAGGMAVLFKELLSKELLHNDVETVVGKGLERYCLSPYLNDKALEWEEKTPSSSNPEVLSSSDRPFSPNGGLKVLKGNLGLSVIKTSSLNPDNLVVEAAAVVFSNQNDLYAAFEAGDLNKDLVAVVRSQGPKARGMPELHKLTPPLSILQDKGFKVALITDGRMSGASGNVPAAIHLTPEAVDGGPIAKILSGDLIRLDAKAGVLQLLVDEEVLAQRPVAIDELSAEHSGYGRELFGNMRIHLSSADTGACSLFD